MSNSNCALYSLIQCYVAPAPVPYRTLEEKLHSPCRVCNAPQCSPLRFLVFVVDVSMYFIMSDLSVLFPSIHFSHNFIIPCTLFASFWSPQNTCFTLTDVRIASGPCSLLLKCSLTSLVSFVCVVHMPARAVRLLVSFVWSFTVGVLATHTSPIIIAPSTASSPSSLHFHFDWSAQPARFVRIARFLGPPSPVDIWSVKRLLEGAPI